MQIRTEGIKSYINEFQILFLLPTNKSLDKSIAFLCFNFLIYMKMIKPV